CIINPLLEGVDGSKKMSKSLGNAIGIHTPPKDMFGLATRVSDELVRKYMELATDLEDEDIERLMAGDIWKAKKTMAGAIVARHYGAETAHKEHQEFERVFAQKQTPDEMPDVVVPAGATVLDLLKLAFGLSGGEAKRLLKQGAVSIDGRKIDDPQAMVEIKGGGVLKAGKRKFARLLRG
ncbi:MAG: S4 domain-containing protein, partial [Planctomycetota bacterium]|nr:S4 domain-containing protein [Planctomycetota bacterium]